MSSIEKILNKYKTSLDGLNQSEATERLAQYGKNELMEDKKDHPIKLFLMQFVDILIALLIVAAIAAFFVGEWVDSIVILIVVVLNAVIGFIQEYRAEKAMEKLKNLVSTEAVVKRNGEFDKIPGDELTLGDIVVVEEGDKIPADLIMIETNDLKIDESSLTGESFPVFKDINSDIGEALNEDAILNIDKSSHDENIRKRFAYMDSNVISGRGIGIVIAIGMGTSIGKIAEMIQEESTETPLQVKIASLSKTLGLLAVVICSFVFALQYLQGHNLVDTFMTSVSLAVAAVPEGLPAILTLTLALGMQKMAKSNAVVRKLLAVETLGSCTVVCTDKTGTLTLNKMSVTDARFSNDERALEICALCNNSSIKDGKVIGDPTDAAVMLYGEDNGYVKYELEKSYPRIKEIPLDSVRKRMTTIHNINSSAGSNIAGAGNNINRGNIVGNNDNDLSIASNENLFVFTKGAPEIILSQCKYIDNNGNIEIIDDEITETIKNNINEMTDSALRVLALAYKKINIGDNDDINNESLTENPDEIEKNLIFVGLAGMMDPPREEAKNAVASCKTAGIKVVMITGDHQSTAASIARSIGILTDGKILTGSDLSKLDDGEFLDIVDDVQVYARVYPEQKVRIVEALQKHKNIVSMTGDGVNDAPALKKASIGVAMGSGTDVSKEAADMIIQDDNFATIVQAIREGRKIFDNIKRFVKFQVSTNVGAILTIVSASILSLPVPFNPIQILWINIIMDGPPAQSLGTEGAEENIMNRFPEKGNILTRNTLIKISISGIVMAVGTLVLYFYELTSTHGNIAIATTVAFTVFVMYQIFNAINNRAHSKEKNNFFWIAILASFLLQLLVIYLPYLQGIFRTTAIGIIEWILIIIVAGTILVSDRIVNRFINT